MSGTDLPALAAALVVLVAAASWVPGRRTRRPDPAGGWAIEAGAPGPVSRLGAVLRGRLRLPHDPGLDRKAGWMLIICLLTVAVSPALTTVVVAAWGTGAVMGRRRRTRALQRQLLDELPDVVDLLLLAVSAGCTVPQAVAVVADHGRGRVAAELDRARRGAAVGSGLAAELDLIPGRLGESVRPVTRALAGALREGVPLGPMLERVAADVRTLRRRAAEERARRVSVRLLFPLVCCVLPAFGLLTVVPLLISALRGISL